VITPNKSIRIFCFFEEGSLIILLNGIVKKANKSPKKELELGIKLKEEYFMEKHIRKNK